MKSLLIALLLTVKVGDKYYDPILTVFPYAINGTTGVCMMTTGWWEVDMVNPLEDGGEGGWGSSKIKNIPHVFFFTFEQNWDNYYEAREPVANEAFECIELNYHIKKFNQCIDYRKYSNFERVCAND